MLVYDITRKESLAEIKYWAEELQKNGPPNISKNIKEKEILSEKLLVLVIVGNKTDLIKQEQISTEEGSAFAKVEK